MIKEILLGAKKAAQAAFKAANAVLDRAKDKIRRAKAKVEEWRGCKFICDIVAIFT